MYTEAVKPVDATGSHITTQASSLQLCLNLVIKRFAHSICASGRRVNHVQLRHSRNSLTRVVKGEARGVEDCHICDISRVRHP